MPLKIRIKPEGKIFVGGAVLKNAGSRPADLVILSDSIVLRDSYLMNADQRDESDASNVYFLLQVLYLFKNKGQPLNSVVMDTIKSFQKMYPHLNGEVDQILIHLEAGESFKALKIGHALLANHRAPASQEPVCSLGVVSEAAL